MIPRSPQFASFLPLFSVHPFSPLLSPTFLFLPHCPSRNMWLLLHQQCWWELTYFSNWSFRHFHLRLLSIPVCLSKDVTGALVCSRGLSSSSCIIVRFIVLSMPGPYLFRPLKQLVATLICSRCECQLRCNRSGRMGYLCTGVFECAAQSRA